MPDIQLSFNIILIYYLFILRHVLVLMIHKILCQVTLLFIEFMYLMIPLRYYMDMMAMENPIYIITAICQADPNNPKMSLH